MATYSDNFDGTSGDFLRNRSGFSRTVGADEVTLTSGGSGYYMTDGAVAADGCWHVPSSQPSGNDQYVEALIRRGSAGNPMPLGVRCDTSAALGQGYVAGWDTTTRVRLYRRSNTGTLTVLGSYTHGNATDQLTNKTRLEVVGTSLTISFMGSVVVGPITDSNFASGNVGLLSRGGTATITTATVDDIEWGDVSGGAVTHAATGALTGPGSTVAGSAAHVAIHAATGALVGPGSTIAGVADHPAAGAHSGTGALVGQGSALAGTATRTRQHVTTGALQGQGALIAGVAAIRRLHTSSGALAGLQAAMTGEVLLPAAPSTDLTVTGGAWSLELSVSGTVRGTGLTVTGGGWA